MSDARKLTKRIATSMAKMVDDLVQLRPVAEEIKNKLDNTSEQGMADCMYKFYEEVARLADDALLDAGRLAGLSSSSSSSSSS